MLKKILLNCIILAIGVAAAFFLLLIVYALPSGRVEKNIYDSIDILKNEGNYFNQLPGKSSTCVDNFTEVLYLELCFITGGKSVLDDALTSYCLSTTDERPLPVENLIAYYEEEFNEIMPRETRFWNGFVVIVKPLLMIFSYADLRLMNTMVQFLLVFYVLHFLCEKKGKWYGMAFFLIWIIQNPFVIAANLMYSGILYSTLLPTLIMLKYNKLLKYRLGYDKFFLFIGMETVYFNMNSSLCMPFGICMVLYVVLNDFEGTLWDQVMKFFIYGISWLIGSGVLWISKWVFASWFTNNYSLKEAVNTIQYRTSRYVGEYKISRLNAIKINMNTFLENKWVVVVIGLMFLICISVILWKHLFHRKGEKKYLRYKPHNALFWYLLLALIPIIWYCIMPNHCYMHHHFTYRTLAIGVFSILCLAIYFVEPFIKEEVKE